MSYASFESLRSNAYRNCASEQFYFIASKPKQNSNYNICFWTESQVEQNQQLDLFILYNHIMMPFTISRAALMISKAFMLDSFTFEIIQNYMNIQFDEDPLESDFENDLLDFEQFRQNKVVEQVMKMKPLVELKDPIKPSVEDDADFIRANNEDKRQANQRRKQAEVTEEQRKARELKILNARKYFELAKLMYLQHVCASFQEVNQIVSNHMQIYSKFLSLLSSDLVREFLKLKRVKALSINIAELLDLIKRAKQHIRAPTKQKGVSLDWGMIFWSICEELQLACRKVHFFTVDSIVEETFFQLKYQSSEAARKRENKKMKQHQIMKIKLSQQIEQNFQAEEDTNKYLLLEDFQFDQASFKNKSQDLRQSQPDNARHLEYRRQHNFLRKKNYKNNYFQLFDPLNNAWILINSEILEQEKSQDMRKLVLEGKFIIGFHSVRILHFKREFRQVYSLRNLKNIVVEDLTMFFQDNHKQLNTRRKRIGLKSIMKHIFQEGSFDKHRFLLQPYDEFVFKKNDELELQYQLTVFPKTKEEMLTSNYFIVPSQLPQYCILDPNAVPVPNAQFHEEKVYLRKNIIAVTSKVHWIDRGRKVKANEIPVKKTQNKSKNLTELFLYEQTEPFSLAIDPERGDFISDGDYNSIYIPKDFIPPPQLTIIQKKVGFVCSKAKIRHAKVVQGFTRAASRIVPNQIGYLIYRQDEPQILKLFEARQRKLQESKDKNRLKELSALWNKLFKKIQLSQWSKSFQQK